MLSDPARPTPIAYVEHSHRLGGGQRSLLDLLSELDRARYSPRLFAPGPGPLAEEAGRLDVPVTSVPALGILRRSGPPWTPVASALRLARGGLALERAWRAAAPALVHANSTTAALFAARSGRTLGVPLVWHLRDLAPLGASSRLLVRRASRAVAISRACAALLAPTGLGDRVRLIPNGLRLPPEAPAPPPADEPLVLVVGQRVPWKGHALALEAAAELLPALPGVRFLVVAPKPCVTNERVELERRAAELGLGERVRITEERDDVPELLARASVLLHPAWPEPFGRVVVEAMAAGRPVIAFGGEHGPAEIVRDGVDGLLVRTREAGALAAALRELLADPERMRRMGAAGRERALSEFGSARLGARIQELYSELLGSTGEAGQDS